MRQRKEIQTPEEWSQEAARQAEELIANSDAEALRLWEDTARRMGEQWDGRILSEKWGAPDFDKIK
jgi:hypothetical protein